MNMQVRSCQSYCQTRKKYQHAPRISLNPILIHIHSSTKQQAFSTEKCVYGNVLLTGDTANQNFKPFVEGNLPGVICGDIAGRLVSNIIRGKEDIQDYNILINKILGPIFKASDEVLQLFIEALKDKNQDMLNILIGSNIFSFEKIKNLFNQDRETLFELITEWNKSRLKQSITQFTEKYYLLYLYLWRKTRLLR